MAQGKLTTSEEPMASEQEPSTSSAPKQPPAPSAPRRQSPTPPVQRPNQWIRDLVFGGIGTIFGGLCLWLITQQIENKSEIKALETVNAKILDILSASQTANKIALAAAHKAQATVAELEAASKNAKRKVAELERTIKATDVIAKNEDSLEELREIAKNTAEAETVQFKEELGKRLDTNVGWPIAISCGVERGSILVLNEYPIDGNGEVWYAQVFPNDFRYVKFNNDGIYTGRGGNEKSLTVGCVDKTISELSNLDRTFGFVSFKD